MDQTGRRLIEYQTGRGRLTFYVGLFQGVRCTMYGMFDAHFTYRIRFSDLMHYPVTIPFLHTPSRCTSGVLATSVGRPSVGAGSDPLGSNVFPVGKRSP